MTRSPQVDENKITATDYAVYVEGLPKTAGRKEIGQFFRWERTRIGSPESSLVCVISARTIYAQARSSTQRRCTNAIEVVTGLNTRGEAILRTPDSIYFQYSCHQAQLAHGSSSLCNVTQLSSATFTNWTRRIGKGARRTRRRSQSSTSKTLKTSGT